MKTLRFLTTGLLMAMIACGWMCWPSAPAAGQEGIGFRLEQVLSAPFPSDLTASPKGERVAWAFDAQGRRNVWGAEGPEFKARQLTAYDQDTGQELTELQFTHDGEWVVYVRGGGENAAGDIPNPTSDPAGVEQAIYAVSFRDGRVRKLGEGNAPIVSPTDNRVVFNRGGQLHLVEIAEGRPISKTKSWTVTRLVEKSKAV